jgi:hypothetical protein
MGKLIFKHLHLFISELVIVYFENHAKYRTHETLCRAAHLSGLDQVVPRSFRVWGFRQQRCVQYSKGAGGNAGLLIHSGR